MHYGTHWHQAFCNWVDDEMPPVAVVAIDYEERHWPADQLLGVMTHCTDVVPGDTCAQLGIERGSTYAQAAQRLLAERKRSTV
jgi:hypothetical protein